MAPPDALRHDQVWARARRRFDAAWQAARPVREECASDRRFYSVTGAMYEGVLEDQFANKPRFEFNKIHKQLIRICGEMRAARIAPDFRPRDDDDALAETCAGLYRADEQDSNAREAYDLAREEGLGGGIGAWRYRAVADPDPDLDVDVGEDGEDGDAEADDAAAPAHAPQRIEIQPIPDADVRCFFDPSSQRQDKRDARWNLTLTGLSREAFEDAWPDHPVASWGRPDAGSGGGFEWCVGDTVYVAEYYEVESAGRVRHVYRGPLHDTLAEGDELTIDDDDHTPARRAELAAGGYRKVRAPRATRPRVRKWLLSGGGVLEDCGHIPGTRIPIAIYYAKRWVIDGVERAMGHVRLGKDPSRILNMQMSRLAEISAMSPIDIPIVTPEQIQGHADDWAGVHLNNPAFLQLNALYDGASKVPSGPVGTRAAPQVPPALAALIQAADQSITDILGSTNPGGQAPANVAQETLAQAQNVADMDAFVYMDNWATAMRMGGEIWLAMAQDLYVEEGRRMKALSEHGAARQVRLKEPRLAAGRTVVGNDLRRARLDVVVDVGPSFTTRRDAEVRTFAGMAQATANANPQLSATLALVALSQMDGQGAKDLRPWLRRTLVAQGVLAPTDEERREQAEAAAAQAQSPPPPLTPADRLTLATAQQAGADAVAALARAGNIQADTDLKRAQTARTEAATAEAHNDAVIALARARHDLGQPES